MGDINIADFNRRIAFKTLTLTPNGVGGNAESYTIGSAIWAKRRQLSANKAIQYGLNELTRSYEYQIRKPAVTPTKKDLISDTGETLRIVSFEEIGDGKTFTKIIATVKE